MSTNITDILSAVTSVVTTATTGPLAIFFYAGIVGIAIGVVSKLKKKA